MDEPQRYSVQFSRSVVSDSLRLHEPQHASLPIHKQIPESTQTHVHWVGDAIQPLILCRPFLLLPSTFPSIRVFSSHFFTSGGQSIGVSASASVLPIHSLKKFISHSSFLLERPNYTSGIRATRPEHCGPTQSVEVCHHKEPLTFCTGFNPSQKACVTVPQILLCFWPS